jgi:long-chain-fatty-acid---luciferin-component ligase
MREDKYDVVAEDFIGRRIEGQAFLDHVLYNEEEMFSWSPEHRRDVTFRLLKENFTHHYANCSPYQTLCRSERFDPDNLRVWGDLEGIPLIPSNVFKHRLLHSCRPEDIMRVCVSSGTQGGKSRIPRDHATLQRFVGATGTQVQALLEPREEAHFYNLGPDTDEAEDLWFAYVMSIVELLRPTTHYVRQQVFYPSTVLVDLSAEASNVQPILIGPPILFLHLVKFMEDHQLRLDLGGRDGLMITAGGWKRFSSEAISRASLTQALCDRFCLPGDDRVRDAFNMVELNTVLVECAQRRKHVPPWLEVIARDPGTLKPVAEGRTGLLSYLDATASSYPAFLLGDDFGSVSSAGCACGGKSPTVEIGRRVKQVESRGCALKLEQGIRVDDNSR